MLKKTPKSKAKPEEGAFAQYMKWSRTNQH